MSEEHSSHATYDELSSPAEQHSDCERARANMPILSKLPVIQVPAQAAYVGEAVRRVATKPVFVVSDAAARVATRLNPFD
jgi:hypothetical protein